MNATLHISGNSTAGAIQSDLLSSTLVSAGANNQPFNVLLSMLDSMLANGVQQTSGQANNSNLQGPAISGFGLPDSSAIPLSRQADGSGSAEDPAANGKAGKAQSISSPAYMAAGIPFLAPYQIVCGSQNFLSPASTSQPSSSQSSSETLSKIGEELSTMMNYSQTPAAGGSTLTTSLSPIPPQDANSKGAATTPQPSEPPDNKSVNADLFKLISAAMNGSPSNKDMKEFSSLVDNLEKGASGSSLTQKLKDTTAAAIARQAADAVHPIALSTAGGTATSRPVSSALDLNGAIASTVKAGTQNSAAQMVRDVNVSTGSNNTNASSVIPATSLVTPNSHVTSTSGNQPAGQTDGIALTQVIRADGSEPGRDQQNASDSGDNLSDMLKQGAVQAYAAASDGSRVDTTFKQVMSAASSNSTASPMKMAPAQIAQSIVKQVNLMTQEGKTVVNMKLQPEDLGTVVLKVASQDGKISAEFNVKTPDARAFLETSIPQMRQSLETNGVTLAHLSVSLSTGDSNGNRPQYQARKQQSKYYSNITAEQVDAARTFGYNTMELKV